MATPDPAVGKPSPARGVASLPTLAVELRDLVVGYLRQETLTPLATMRRYLAFGIAGSLLLGLGVIFLAVGVLRLLQTETGDTFAGDWSWVPYLLVVVILVVGGGLTWAARGMVRDRKDVTR